MAKKVTRKRTSKRGGSGSGLREAWSATLEALTAAEQEMEKQLRRLVNSRIETRDAQALLRRVGARVQARRRQALRELDGRVQSLQARVQKERKVLGRAVDEAVRGALAAFNIPSRQEVAELTRKVDELSRKIDGFKRRPARAAVRRRPAPAHAAAAAPAAQL